MTSGKVQREYMTVAQVAEMFSVTPKAVHLWIAEGKLPGSFKVSEAKNQPFMIPVAAVEALKKARGKS